MFDRSALGLNHWLGIRVRCMLGRHIFAHLGKGVRIYPGVELRYGYNLSIGGGAVIRQGALLDDLGGITIGDRAVIGSYARIFSLAHHPEDYEKVRLTPTVIGPGARIGSHAIVLAGQHVAAGEAVGSFPADGV